MVGIGPKKRACIDWSGQLPVCRQTGSNPGGHRAGHETFRKPESEPTLEVFDISGLANRFFTFAKYM
jgi:hypothetical protein